MPIPLETWSVEVMGTDEKGRLVVHVDDTHCDEVGENDVQERIADLREVLAASVDLTCD